MERSSQLRLGPDMAPHTLPEKIFCVAQCGVFLKFYPPDGLESCIKAPDVKSDAF